MQHSLKSTLAIMQPIIGKVLAEQIPNIYTFLGDKSFLFQIKSLIILTILAKKYLNSLSHEYYQEFFFQFTCFYIHKSIPLKVYVQKNLFATFPHFWFSRYCRFRCIFGKRDLYQNFLAVNFGHTYIPTNGNLHLSLFNIEIFYCLLIFF